MTIKLKRVYRGLERERGEGKWYLVERLWPGGMKTDAHDHDGWLKDIAPSTQLRQWFGHDPERWPEFKKRYRAELKEHEKNEASEEIDTLLKAARRGNLTLLYSAKDTEQNSAIVLREYLEKRLKE